MVKYGFTHEDRAPAIQATLKFLAEHGKRVGRPDDPEPLIRVQNVVDYTQDTSLRGHFLAAHNALKHESLFYRAQGSVKQWARATSNEPTTLSCKLSKFFQLCNKYDVPLPDHFVDRLQPEQKSKSPSVNRNPRPQPSASR